MYRIPSDGRAERRQALTSSTSWRLFLVAWGLSILALIIAWTGSPEIRQARTLGIVFAAPAGLMMGALFYCGQTVARNISWQELATLYFLRLCLWLGIFWQTLCLFYLLIDWGSGRGLAIWFPG